MRAVRVQYTVNPEYVEQNKANIKKVMQDLLDKPLKGMNYSSFYMSDGKFMHLNLCKDEETLAKFNELESFIEFRTQLKASVPVSPPKSEDLELVGSNSSIF